MTRTSAAKMDSAHGVDLFEDCAAMDSWTVEFPTVAVSPIPSDSLDGCWSRIVEGHVIGVLSDFVQVIDGVAAPTLWATTTWFSVAPLWHVLRTTRFSPATLTTAYETSTSAGVGPDTTRGVWANHTSRVPPDAKHVVSVTETSSAVCTSGT